MEDTKTTSLCHICYRHCVAERVTMPDGVYLKKTCVEHGESTHLLETDINFYNQLEYDTPCDISSNFDDIWCIIFRYPD